MSTGAWIGAGIAAALSCLVVMKLLLERETEDISSRCATETSGFFVDIPCGRTYAALHGDEQGEVVVLVPGATLPLWIWRHLPAALASRGYRVLTFDLLGRGLSARPRIRYDEALFDTQLVQLLDTLGISARVHMVGLAFGCLIAAAFARRHPPRVRSVGFLGPDGFGVSMTRGDLLKQLPVLGGLLMGLFGNSRLMERLDRYTSSEPVLAWLRTNYAPELKTKGFKRALLSSIRNMPIHDARDCYRAIDVSATPLIAVWGQNDSITPIPGSEQLDDIFKHSPVRILANVGHLPHVEALQETTEILGNFFQKSSQCLRSETV